MARQYETYLSRLKQIKQRRPEMDVYNRTMQAQSKPFNLLNESTARITQQGGASTGAQVAALNQGRQQWNHAQQGAYNTALNATVQRNENLDMKIAEVEAANEAEKERAAIERGQKKAEAVKAGLTIAGAVIGSVIPGAGTLAGASVGAAIGQTVGGFVGSDKDGNLSVNPEDWDSQAIIQGAANTISSLSANANETKMKNTMSLIAQNTALIQQAYNNNPDGAAGLTMQIEMLAKAGDVEGLRSTFQQMQQMATGRIPVEAGGQDALEAPQEPKTVTQVGEPITDFSDLRQTVSNLGYKSDVVNDDEQLMQIAVEKGLVIMNPDGTYSWVNPSNAGGE